MYHAFATWTWATLGFALPDSCNFGFLTVEIQIPQTKGRFGTDVTGRYCCTASDVTTYRRARDCWSPPWGILNSIMLLEWHWPADRGQCGGLDGVRKECLVCIQRAFSCLGPSSASKRFVVYSSSFSQHYTGESLVKTDGVRVTL